MEQLMENTQQRRNPIKDNLETPTEKDNITGRRRRTDEEILNDIKKKNEEYKKQIDEQVKKQREEWIAANATCNAIKTYLEPSSKFLDIADSLDTYIEDVLLSRHFKTKELIEDDVSLMKRLASKLNKEYDELKTVFQRHEHSHIQALKELFKMHSTRDIAELEALRCTLGDVDMPKGVEHWVPPTDKAEVNGFLSHIKYKEDKMKEKEGGKWFPKDQTWEYRPLDRDFMENRCICLNQRRHTAALEMHKMIPDIIAFDKFRDRVDVIIKCLEQTVNGFSFKSRIAEAVRAIQHLHSAVEKAESSGDSDVDVA